MRLNLPRDYFEPKQESDSHGALAQLAYRAADEETGGSSTTETPTTTGTWSGMMYGAEHRDPLATPSEAETEQAIDLYGGFMSPTMKMRQVGVDKALRGTMGEERGQLRDLLRRLLRASNRIPDEGPQGIAERADAIRGAAELPSRTRNEVEAHLANRPQEIWNRVMKREGMPPPEHLFEPLPMEESLAVRKARLTQPPLGQKPGTPLSTAEKLARAREAQRLRGEEKLPFIEAIKKRAKMDEYSLSPPPRSVNKMPRGHYDKAVEYQPVQERHRARMHQGPPNPWPPKKE